jgi:hypothetical protein
VSIGIGVADRLPFSAFDLTMLDPGRRRSARLAGHRQPPIAPP